MGTYSYIGSGLSLPDAFRGCPIWLDFSWAWLSGSSELLFPDASLYTIQHQCKGNVEHPSAYGRMLVVYDVVLLCKVEYVYAVCVSTSLMCCVLQRLPFLYARWMLTNISTNAYCEAALIHYCFPIVDTPTSRVPTTRRQGAEGDATDFKVPKGQRESK
jgi:hypothetical protein